MYNDLYWNLHPGAESDAGRCIASYARYCVEHEIDAGVVSDAHRDGLPIRVDSGVAVISIMGIMVRSAGPIARLFGLVGTDSLRLALEAALDDDDVDQVLLRMDSPGGSISGLSELADVINSAKKPVTVQVEGVAASAAYYVASQADRIMVGRTDLVGSIGIRMLLYDFHRAFEKDGVEAVPIDTGEFKSAAARGTEITKNQRADFQRLIDFYFEDFVSMVARGRKMDDSNVRQIADGRMFSPAEAVGFGLIDGVATFDQTLEGLRAKRKRSTDSARAMLRL